ncbi:MAG: YCF48-related protein, partial [Ignavibacteria bacterium]|nr:YCF48-related protein [Ignavibacteria bacterium]
MNSKCFRFALATARRVLFSLPFAIQLFTVPNYAQQLESKSLNYTTIDTTAEKPTQYRRGIELQPSYQSYDEKYAGKNLDEEKRRLFPLQSGTGVWTELHPNVPRVNYWGVYFRNKDTGLATGELGAIIKTTDSGNSWYNIETNYNKTIRTIGSYTGDKIIAAGDSGLITISTDFGETWESTQSGTNSDLWHMLMINNNLGWIVGFNSTLLKTTDGGNNWQLKTTPVQGYNFFDVSFLDTSFGYIACSGGLVLRTTDGGDNWDVRQAGDAYSLTVIKAITRQEAVAFGFAGKHVYTYDGGESWQFIGYVGDTFRQMAFLDTLKGFAVTTASGYETTDGGRNWTVRYDMTHGNSITFAGDGTGYKVSTGLAIEKTTNSGQTWDKAIINDDFTDVYFATKKKGWFIGEGFGTTTLYQTNDGGTTLIARNDFPGLHPYSVYFLDSLTGIVGANNSIYKTTDGGILWEEKEISGVDSVGTAGEYDRIFFINDDTGWALNTKYVIKTTDEGENWSSQLNGGGLTGIHFSDSLNGWVTRESYLKPFKTIDGGGTWTEHTNFPSDYTKDALFNDSLNGFITRI